MFEFHVSRLAREKYDFNQSLFSFDGNVIFANFIAAREFAQKINNKRDLVNFPEQAIRASEINAMGLIDEINHLVVSLYCQSIDPNIIKQAYQELELRFGSENLTKTLKYFTIEFPPLPVYREEISAEAYLESETNGTLNKHITLEEIMMLWITNRNPAVTSFSELFDDTSISRRTIYRQVMDTLQGFFKDKPSFGPIDQDLVTMLRSPAIAAPNSLSGQLEYIRKNWGFLLGSYLYRLLSSIDLIHEETKPVFTGPGPTYAPSFELFEDEENFSPDSDWMPRTVMIAKNTYVWLHQLSEKYHQEIKRLDQIPAEELDKLAHWGFNGLWLIGLWERSSASRQIKQMCGNPEAVASAYSLKNYTIADALGGEEAYQNLKDRAWKRGIRLASDMVPNHMGIDSDWVIEHPDWFISQHQSPFPSYSFNGPDLSPVDHIGLFIEDHYYDRTDASVVFKRLDKNSGQSLFIYHGNDGTSMPWNDTAQLNYLRADVREAVIQTILHVARKFPIIRFDAAMTLAKKHYQRLWFPQPGMGGAIPSRAERGLTKAEFDSSFPKEFWREVVDRVAHEVPDTLLLAEAFWMMEGFFVRTLGMHRVYNSAFMNMLRNEENIKYRMVIKNTLEFDPQILKRYVNFMNNPDEKTAVEQFGKGDKYFGICTLMATMPGLPMFGHGQIEGLAEKYGMEYFRPYWDEDPDMYLIQRHQTDVFPLIKRRELFSGVRNFLLFDFFSGEGRINEDVFAYSNGVGEERALVVYHNYYGSTQGWIHTSASFLNKETGFLNQRKVHDGLNLKNDQNHYVIFEDSSSGMEYIRACHEVKDKGLYFELNAYDCHVFINFREVEDNNLNQYAQLCGYLNGRGVPSIDEALRELLLAPIIIPLRNMLSVDALRTIYQAHLTKPDEKIDKEQFHIHAEKYQRFIEAIKHFINSEADTKPILREQQRGLEAILELNIFGEKYPFPASEKYESALGYIQANLDTYPFIWLVLILWNDLRLMGRVLTSAPQFAEISRSWMEEWGIVRLIEQILTEFGLDAGQAQSGVTLIKLLTSQQNWIDEISTQTPLGLLESWLSKETIRSFLNINRYREKLWFNKENFESLMWWMMAIALIGLVADPERSFAESVEYLIEAYDQIQTILDAEKDSKYQVDNLLEGLK